MISTLWESFYSAPLYRRVQYWRAKALIYLWLILILCWTPTLVRVHRGMLLLCRHAQTDILPKIPTIRFEQGHIITEENRPYLFRLGDGTKEKVLAIMDTSGHYTSLDGQEAQMLLTGTKFFVRQKTGEVRIYDLSKNKMKPLTIDQDFLQKILRYFKLWVIPAIYIGIFFLSYIKRLMQAFFIALAGLLLASAMEAELDLGELLSLAIVAMTPAMVIETILTVSGKSFRFQWIFWFVLIVGYFVFAINAASDKTVEADTPL